MTSGRPVAVKYKQWHIKPWRQETEYTVIGVTVVGEQSASK